MANDIFNYTGGCHCGSVRFNISITEHLAIECNCSICQKKGFIHLIVPKENFTLLSGIDQLSTYTFNTGVAKHTFCKICGIHSFYIPRSHPNDFDVNVRCLDDNVLSKFNITHFDGTNWEDHIHLIQ